MTSDRRLKLEGCFNARDLGGIPTKQGPVVREGAVVRADGLDELSKSGWDALLAHGVRTVIDLRNDDERKPDTHPRPETITTVHSSLDNFDDKEFWAPWITGPQFGTPLYYQAHLETYPERSAGVIAAIAHAQPGGVLFHCAAGRDRTGMIAILLLSLLGVADEHIIADYLLSEPNLGPFYEHRGIPNMTPIITDFMAEQGKTLPGVIADTLRTFDRDKWMREGGLGEEDLKVLRARLLRE